MRFTRITIIRSTKPEKKDVNKELQWFGGTLGLFNLRDKDKSCFRIFITLLNGLKSNQQLTSDEVAIQTKLSRGTVIHHLHKLMESGIVIKEHNKYILRMDNLEQMVDYIKQDVDQAWNKLKEVAKDIDEKLGLK
ncbi:MAG: ArsR family transcriptional regulator [Nanoarchaeota archaeon]|nr:ArsR family transcriptional regulator [Nanoarchaeota archaeon]MBU1321509.1 ArsR family transcriptional regulator [Nanoarchaeota archaeon]MBU1597126.1 ArsR family transcriptional regulator [Nanoarchaeota archaeon]MBU2441540.1 ArsR family transcriptional regulator [Nanoarchaeota archaeon]